MDSILSELQTRLKSPFFAYFLVSFIAFNWDTLFVLFFDSGLVSYRVEYFRDGTDFWSTVVCPFSLAALYMVGYPWLQFGFLKINTKATAMQSNLKIQAEHNAIAEKTRLEAESNRLLKQREEEAVNRAKRDQAIDQIVDDEGSRSALKAEIKRLRQENDSQQEQASPKAEEITTEHFKVLRLIAAKGGDIASDDFYRDIHLSKVKADFLLQDLIEKQMLIKTSHGGLLGTWLELTQKSRKLLLDNNIAD